MKRNIICIFTVIIIFSGSGCSNLSQTTPVTSEEIDTPQFFAATKHSLEVYRNGKTYEILIGYDMGRRATSIGEAPKTWSENYVDGAQIEASSDFDNDGETEILISAFVCGANCSIRSMVYEYDATNDAYFISDEIWASLRDYEDFDNDGKPEFTFYDYGFCFRCSRASDALSALTILRYEKGKFIDVSTEFPELIQEHADRFLESAINNEQDAVYIYLPGYLYDMYRLGKIDEGRIIFDEVCRDVINYDCENFRLEVEKSILEYKVRQ